MSSNVTQFPANGTSPPRVSGSPEAIDAVFRRLHSYYGAQWLDRWADANLAEVKQDWAQALADCTLDSVTYALANLRSEFPPSLPEFRELCRQFRRPRPQSPPAVEDKRVVAPSVMQGIRDILNGKKKATDGQN